MAVQNDDAVYFRMREQEERELAEKAAVQEARRVHQTLADKYHSLALKAEHREVRGLKIVAVQGALLSESI